MFRRLLALSIVTVLLAASSVVSAGGSTSRILLAKADAAALGLSVRNDLGHEVSVDASSAVMGMLTQRGVSFRLAVKRSLAGVEVSAKPSAKPGGTRAVPSDPTPYGIEMIYGDQTIATTSGGSGIRVAVLDTGKVDHLDFTRADGSSIFVDCVDFSSNKSPQIEGSCKDGHGHGTHVTGTVAAAGGKDGKGIWGVAPDADIMAYKVLADSGFGWSDDISRAIRVAAERGAHIISMSLGSDSGSAEERDAIIYANSLGTLVIAAAGNSGPGADTIGYPAAFKEVVAVAALDNTEMVADFSSRGLTDGDDTTIVDREVEVAGPGVGTESTAKDGTYVKYSGTSMATPHIAGLAAKMWQGSNYATRSWLVSQAKQHDITTGQHAGAGYDIASGYGLPQVVVTGAQSW